MTLEKGPKWEQKYQAAQGKEKWWKRNARNLNSEEYTNAETLIMYAWKFKHVNHP